METKESTVQEKKQTKYGKERGDKNERKWKKIICSRVGKFIFFYFSLRFASVFPLFFCKVFVLSVIGFCIPLFLLFARLYVCVFAFLHFFMFTDKFSHFCVFFFNRELVPMETQRYYYVVDGRSYYFAIRLHIVTIHSAVLSRCSSRPAVS